MAQLTKKKPVQERSKATVLAILEAAGQVLAAEGPLKITTHKIAKRAGVSVGTLYQYFPNKQAVFSELLRQYREQSMERLMAGVASTADGSIDNVIDVAIDSFIEPFFDNPDLTRAIMQNRDMFTSRDERVEMMERVQMYLATAFELRKDIPSVPDVELFAFTLVRVTEALSTAAVTDRPEALQSGALKRELKHLVKAYMTMPRATSSS